MKSITSTFKNIVYTVIILSISFVLSLLLQNVFHIPDHITTIFVFAVFIVSIVTEGYIYGLASALIGTIAINYAFTFPFFALNFTIPENIISAIIMFFISIVTSTLTIKIKQQESIRSESERERMRANLLRAVSHDLRTPLTTIYGSACAIIDNNDNFSDKQKLQMLNGIKEDSEWLIGMVENLLSVTKIDSGKVKLIKTPTVLEELIDSVIIKFNKRYPSQTIDIDIPEEMVIIPMDAILIQQVIINILENSIHHAHGMTKLSLSVSLKNSRAIFRITDNGCGIDPAKLPDIFSGGHAASEESSDTHKRNAGIGLSVCSTIIKAHGGEISAQNAEGGGASFSFILNTEEVTGE